MLALRKRLEELESQLVAGGSEAGNTRLKEELEHRRTEADERRERLRNAADEDGVLEEIYDSMQVNWGQLVVSFPLLSSFLTALGMQSSLPL